MNLQDFYAKMGKHQKNAIKAMANQTKGQIIMPTGVGKTWVQVYKILETLLSTESGIALQAAHRLLLCEQLIKEVLKRAFEFGLEGKFDILSVGSEGVDEDDVIRINTNCKNLSRNCNITRTTSSEDIKTAVDKAKLTKRHLLIVSTYQSIARLSKTHIDIACMDEAHEITKGDKHENVSTMLTNCSQVFFFTATPVHDCNTRGMDNETFFGKKLIVVSPRAAIDEGNILPPMVHTIKREKDKPTDHNIIKSAFLEHRVKVLEYSQHTIGPKLLVSTQGVDDMIELVTNASFHRWAIESGFHVIAFSSKGYYINGIDVSRKEAIDALLRLDDAASAIIMHYDILTEGIDLPNITGILPLRELNKVKFLQTAGRAARLQKSDRKRLEKNISLKTYINEENKVVVVKDTKTNNTALLKPVFWIIQNPLLNQEALDTNENLIEIIRTAYGVDPEIRNVPPESTSTILEEAEDIIDTGATERSTAKQANFIHEYEAMIFNEMTREEQMQEIDRRLDLIEQGKISPDDFQLFDKAA